MSNKEFTTREKGMVKNAAKTVYPMYAKLEKMRTEIEKMNKNYETLQSQIDVWEAGVKNLTNGFTTQDLVQHSFIEVVDKEGKIIKKSNFTLKYEDTLVPVDTTPVNFTEVLNDNNDNTINC